jgi:serine/threonine protein kinase
MGPRWWVKLADFGFSKRAIDSHAAAHTVGGTPLYMAPELQGVIKSGIYTRPENVTYTEAVDIWAVGIMTFQILAGHPPFCSGEIEQYTIGKLRFPIKPLRKVAASDEACNFVRSLMTPQPTRRPNAKECLQQYWLQAQATLSGNPTISFRGDSWRDNPPEELQDVSGTWASEQVFQVEADLEGRTSNFEKPNSATTLFHSIASGTAPTVYLTSPTTNAGNMNQRAPETAAPKRHIPRQALPEQPPHSQSSNASNVSAVPGLSPKLLTETNRQDRVRTEYLTSKKETNLMTLAGSMSVHTTKPTCMTTMPYFTTTHICLTRDGRLHQTHGGISSGQ